MSDRVRAVRHSQTISPFGVGAIVDLQAESLVACDIYQWGNNRGAEIHSPRLRSALGVTGLYSAPVVDSADGRAIPYARFPAWLFCPRCRRMTRWSRELENDDAPECPHCPGHRKLAPMRWIQICPEGHLDDVDWWWWVHRGASACAVRDRLSFITRSGAGTAGLDTVRVRCDSCSSSRSLAGISATGSARRAGMSCRGRQPWERLPERGACSAEIRIVQRGASNVYFPVVHSSIEVPDPANAPTHSESALAVQNDRYFSALVPEDDSAVETMLVGRIAAAHGVDRVFVIALLEAERARAAGAASKVDESAVDLRGQEWAAFLTPTDDHSDPDFSTRHVGLTSKETSLALPSSVVALLDTRISSVVVADRLREVRALEGFHRVTPAPGSLVRADLGRGLGWLPAVEVRGEGIFVALDRDRVAAWESEPSVQLRVANLAARVDQSFQRDRILRLTGSTVSPRYVLLHTLAHLVVRRLAYETGYSAASLRERVYARAGQLDGSDEAGFLVYTAAGDSEGTLGGLVRQGEPPRFASRIIEALSDARWCASDPLCAESRATSFDGMNLAACHACSFVSETSCEIGNFLLDRVVVVGSDTVPGYFGPVLDGVLDAAVRNTR